MTARRALLFATAAVTAGALALLGVIIYIAELEERIERER